MFRYEGGINFCHLVFFHEAHTISEVLENGQWRRILDSPLVIKTSGQFYEFGFILKIMDQPYGNFIITKDHNIFSQFKPSTKGNYQDIENNSVEKHDGSKSWKAENDKKAGKFILIDEKEK